MWQFIDIFKTLMGDKYGLYKRTDDGVTVYRCDTMQPADHETGGYFRASAALQQKGL